MSFCSFRRVFRPTLEEQIHDLKQIIRLHDGAIGDCYTCEHYIPSDAPGFVTDFGSCDRRNELFVKKLIAGSGNSMNIHCPEYKERSIDDLREKLAELERDVIEDGRNPFEKFILNRFERKE